MNIQVRFVMCIAHFCCFAFDGSFGAAPQMSKAGKEIKKKHKLMRILQQSRYLNEISQDNNDESDLKRLRT